MKLETAQKIVEAAGDDYEEGEGVSLYEDYSGRGMYGKMTAAVTGDLSAIIAAIAMAAYEAGCDEEGPLDLGRVRVDDLGRGVVVY